MVDLKPAATNDGLLQALRVAIERARDSAVATNDIFALLSSLDPLAALDTLLDGSQGNNDDATSAVLSQVIGRGLSALRSEPSKRSDYASRVLRNFTSRLEAATAVDVASAIVSYDCNEDREALDTLVCRFPSEAGLLRIAVRVAQSVGFASRADALLTRLGLADPTLATVTFVHRARIAAGSAPLNATARIAFVSSFTIDPLVPFVDLACRSNGISPESYVAPFNSWMRDVIDPMSGLRAFLPDITFLSVAIDDLVPELVGKLEGFALEEAAKSALERVLAVVDEYLAWAAGRPLVVHRFHSAFASPLGILDGATGPARVDWLATLNARLATALRERPGCYALDVAGVVAEAGGTLVDNPKLRHIASMRLPPASLAGVAAAYVRYIVPARGLVKKCVVLDLDNTLWGGVVGEDGQHGIRLSANAQGAEYFEFQTFLRTLSDRGILLAVNSKNNPDDALAVIRTHEAMVLRESDFSALRINWKAKSENMLEIARELNIGLDSLVFIDDNPDERDRMRQMLPDVLTIEMPRDPAQYRATVEALPVLQSLAITNEDRGRVAHYESARLRSQAKAQTGDVESYLRSLEIQIAIKRATPATFSRVAQLFAKTNQFNTTTRRYVLADIEAFAADPSFRLWTLVSRDRFGEHGLVAIALVRVGSTMWEIDSFLMSCRVIGYGIESALLAHVAENARSSGAMTLDADFIESKKNVPANDLYARHGFASANSDSTVERWTLALTEELPFPSWIERII